MNEFVLRRKEELDSEAMDMGKERRDLFSRLVSALDPEAKTGLSMQEVVSSLSSFSCPRQLLNLEVDWKHLHLYVCWPR